MRPNSRHLDKLRTFGRAIIKEECNLDELYKKYRLRATESGSEKVYQIVRQALLWLYDMRLKNQCFGLIYIDLVLFSINKEMKKDLSDLQEIIVREILYLYLQERSYYCTKKRGY